MGLYEDLLVEHDYIEVRETDVVPNNLPGVWLGDLILIKRNLSDTRKAEILLEELGHHKLTYGDIVDQTQFNNRKFENYARRYGYEAALPLRIIVEAHHYGVSSLYELAEYVQLSEEHVLEILEYYKQKYGIGTHYGDYSITFQPLRVYELHQID